MAKVPVGKVCGKVDAGAGRKMGLPLLSVVGIVLTLVSLGADETVCTPAGLVNVEDSPNEPDWSKSSTIPCPTRSYTIPNPPRTEVLPSPNTSRNNPSLNLGAHANATRGPRFP